MAVQEESRDERQSIRLQLVRSERLSLATNALAPTRLEQRGTTGTKTRRRRVAWIGVARASLLAVRRDRRNDRRNGVGSLVDPFRLGDTMSTRTIAIAALVIAVVVVIVLFVL
jgi:hypothetical protein